MWRDQVSNPGPLTYESGALPAALRGPAAMLTDNPDMTKAVYCGLKTTTQHNQLFITVKQCWHVMNILIITEIG